MWGEGAQHVRAHRWETLAEEFIQRVGSKKRVAFTTRALASLNSQHMQALEQVWALTNQVPDRRAPKAGPRSLADGKQALQDTVARVRAHISYVYQVRGAAGVRPTPMCHPRRSARWSTRWRRSTCCARSRRWSARIGPTVRTQSCCRPAARLMPSGAVRPVFNGDGTLALRDARRSCSLERVVHAPA